MSLNLEWGFRTEENALRHLIQQGRVRCLARNFRTRSGEVDLILEEQRGERAMELVFVEVRARSPGGWVSAEESVTLPKRMRLRRAISEYLVDYRGPARTLRVDVMAWDGVSWLHLKDIRL